MIILLGHEYKRGLSGEYHWEEGDRKGYCGVKRIKVGYIFVYEYSIMNPTKHWKGGRRRT
jgi:hypothetical protein